jgi:hypothetical protein
MFLPYLSIPSWVIHFSSVPGASTSHNSMGLHGLLQE